MFFIITKGSVQPSERRICHGSQLNWVENGFCTTHDGDEVENRVVEKKRR